MKDINNQQIKQRDYDKEPIVIEDYNYIFLFFTFLLFYFLFYFLLICLK